MAIMEVTLKIILDTDDQHFVPRDNYNDLATQIEEATSGAESFTKKLWALNAGAVMDVYVSKIEERTVRFEQEYGDLVVR